MFKIFAALLLLKLTCFKTVKMVESSASNLAFRKLAFL